MKKIFKQYLIIALCSFLLTIPAVTIYATFEKGTYEKSSANSGVNDENKGHIWMSWEKDYAGTIYVNSDNCNTSEEDAYDFIKNSTDDSTEMDLWPDGIQMSQYACDATWNDYTDIMLHYNDPTYPEDSWGLNIDFVNDSDFCTFWTDDWPCGVRSDIYIDGSVWSSISTTSQARLIMHETGHSLGLDHHCASDSIMNDGTGGCNSGAWTSVMEYQDIDRESITAVYPLPDDLPVVTVSGTILSDTTWQRGFVYEVTSDITVYSGVTLTLNPGVIVKFNSGKGIIVNGTLDVNGTSTDPVYLTSIKDDTVGGDTNDDDDTTSPSSGDWRHIYLNSGTAYFDYAVVRYGGSSGYNATNANIHNNGGTLNFENSTSSTALYYAIRQAAGSATATLSSSTLSGSSSGLYVQDGNITISDNTLKDNSYAGISADAGADSLSLSNNAFNNNSSYAVHMNPNVDLTESGSTVSGNGGNGIYMPSSSVTDTTQTWTKTSIPYILDNITINSGKTLTVNAGSIIKFGASSKRLSVNGTLDVNGSSGNEVYFTSLKDDSVGGDTNDDGSSTGSSGDWRDIHITSSGDADFKHTIVRQGGSTGSGYSNANVYNNGGDLNFENSTSATAVYYAIRQAAGSAVSTLAYADMSNKYIGVYIQDGEIVISNSDIQDNSYAGIYADSGTDSLVVNNSNIAGNSSYGIYAPSIGFTADAENNWWGASDGPSGEGPGSGDAVSTNVDYNPFETAEL